MWKFYKTLLTHELKIQPYEKNLKYIFWTGWKQNKVYPNLGCSSSNVFEGNLNHKCCIRKKVLKSIPQTSSWGKQKNKSKLNLNKH